MDVFDDGGPTQAVGAELVLERGYVQGTGVMVYRAYFKDFHPECKAVATTAHEAVRLLVGTLEQNEYMLREIFTGPLPPRKE